MNELFGIRKVVDQTGQKTYVSRMYESGSRHQKKLFRLVSRSRNVDPDLEKTIGPAEFKRKVIWIALLAATAVISLILLRNISRQNGTGEFERGDGVYPHTSRPR